MDADDFQQNNEHGGYPIFTIRSRSMRARFILRLLPFAFVVGIIVGVLRWLGYLGI